MMFNNFVTRPFLRPLFMLLVMVASNVRSSSLLLRGSDGSFSAFDNRRITDENLILYCPQKNKTCSPQEEHRYLDASVTEFDKRIRDLLYDDYYPTLESKAHEFNELINQTLFKSHKDFDEMFGKTYGRLYEIHKKIFNDLFKAFNSYYETGNSPILDKDVHNFFLELFQRMFEEINIAYSFDAKYMNCVDKRMIELRVFGDTPTRLTTEIKRSFIATRTFYQAIITAKDVIRNATKISPTHHCYLNIMRMRYCQHCQGLGFKPCRSLCINVMNSCLHNYLYIQREWDKFVGTLDKLAVRLQSPFNIEGVIGPLDIKISEAIMNFQERSSTVSGEIFKICGKPRVRKRAQFKTRPFDSLDYAARKPRESNSLSDLVFKIKKKFKAMKDMWSKLPNSICDNLSVSIDEAETNSCWNQTASGIEYSSNDPGLFYTKRQEFIAIAQHLKVITCKNEQAHNGFDTDTCERTSNDDENDDEESHIGHEIGSGSGSGDGDDEEYYPQPTPSSIPDSNGIYFDPQYASSVLTNNNHSNTYKPIKPPSPGLAKDSSNSPQAKLCFIIFLLFLLLINDQLFSL